MAAREPARALGEALKARWEIRPPSGALQTKPGSAGGRGA